MGFRLSETMSGEHEFRDGRAPAGPFPCALRLRWGPERLRDWLNPLSGTFLWQEAAGELRFEGLCDWTPCKGTLELDYFRRRRIRYELDLEHEGVAYRFVGEKLDLRPWNLAVSHTTCFGTLIELGSGRLVSTSLLRFRLSDLPGFVLSWRPWF